MNGFSSSSSSSRPSRNLEPAPRIVPQPESQQVTHPAPLVLSLLFAPVNILYNVLSKGLGILGYLFPFLPRLLTRISGRTASRSSRSSTGGRRPLNSRDTAARFIREFEEEYGENTLPFFENGYAQAYDAAKRDLKYLLVVLLSPEHDDTSTFVRDTFLSSEVAAFLDTNKNSVVLWAGNVQDPEAYQVASELNCTKFPFSALIVHTPSQSSTAMSTVLRVAGPMPSAAAYVAKLQGAMSQHAADLERARSTRAEQQASRSLRDQQNTAYERSLAQDRERARQRREAEESQRQAEREARDREAAEEREKQNLEQWRRWRAKSIKPEPDAEVKDAVRISIRMADGERLVRKFTPEAAMEELYAFVECHDLLADGEDFSDAEEPSGWTHEYKFRLVSPMPRTVFELDEGGTVKEKIGRSGNLIVERTVTEEEDEEE